MLFGAMVQHGEGFSLSVMAQHGEEKELACVAMILDCSFSVMVQHGEAMAS